VVRYKAVAGSNFISFLPTPKMYQVIPNNIQYIDSPNKYNKKNQLTKFFYAVIVGRTGQEFPYNRLRQTLSHTSDIAYGNDLNN
jgi:hypothetical protein